jgi:hypothetical protein
MAFNARTLAPWQTVSVDFTTIDEYCTWFNEITGDLLDAKTADWLDVWLKAAPQHETLWLDGGDSRPCQADEADIQIMRN